MGVLFSVMVIKDPLKDGTNINALFYSHKFQKLY